MVVSDVESVEGFEGSAVGIESDITVDPATVQRELEDVQAFSSRSERSGNRLYMRRQRVRVRDVVETTNKGMLGGAKD